MKKPISLLLCILLAACLFVPVYAAEGGPAETTNYGGQNYDRWAVPVNSYLFENPSGGLTRVEYADGKVIVEHYDDTFNYSSYKESFPNYVYGGNETMNDGGTLPWNVAFSESSDSSIKVTITKQS